MRSEELYQPYTFGATLTDVECEDLVTLATQRTFVEGQALLPQGDVGDYVVILCRGTVKVIVETSRERSILLGLRGPGDLLGEMRYLSGEPRSANVIAAAAGTALVVDFDSLNIFLKRHSRMGFEVARCVNDRLRWADRRRVEFCLSVTARVARVLYELGCQSVTTRVVGRRVGNMEIPVTQKELGQLVGAAEVSVQKALRQLAKLGGVTRRYGRVSITRLDILRDYSDDGAKADPDEEALEGLNDRPGTPWGL